MKPPFIPCLLSLLLLLVPLGSNLEGQTIRGRVLMAGDTVGVDGVTVSLRGQTGEPSIQVQGDENGFFQIPISEPGHYNLMASRIGYSSFGGGPTGATPSVGGSSFLPAVSSRWPGL